MNKVPVIYKKDTFITAMIDNRPFTCTSSEPIFTQIVQSYKDQDWELMVDLFNRPKLIEKYSDGNIKVFDGVVTYKNKEVHNYVVDRILDFMEDGLDISPLCKFLDSLMLNPNPDIQIDLFRFLEVNEMAITEDGGFLAYKLTKQDGSPYYNDDGCTKYFVGAKLEMDRNKISTQRTECYGPGYYFGNKGYWNNCFDDQNRYTGDGRMFIVKLMPEWVVSIPSGEAQTKGRAYKMEVVGEYESVRDIIYSNEVVKVDEVEIFPDYDEDEDYESDEDVSALDQRVLELTKSLRPDNKVIKTEVSAVKSIRRDKNGRFMKKNAPVRDSKGRFVQFN